VEGVDSWHYAPLWCTLLMIMMNTDHMGENRKSTGPKEGQDTRLITLLWKSECITQSTSYIMAWKIQTAEA